jgi:N-acetylmuramoyl-L-alanine amidase
VARQLRRAIETRFGMRVLQTRDDDRRVGSDERAAYANNAKADLFISLHANASPQPTVRGAEVMYLELDRYGDEARRQAQLEGAWLPVFGGDSREIELVPWDLAQARHVERSGVLARIAERALGDRIEVGRRGVQQGPIRVLIGVNMPAVLIEMGYLTNLEEAQALASSAHQADIVQALTDTIGAFRDFLQSGAASTAGTGVPAPAVDRVARRP